ncbi:MAG TPA: HAD-IC family P-type ATPase [Candidatus Saccharimonadales bacterium]
MLPQTFTGLTSDQVAERVAAGKTNAIAERSSRSLGDILRANIFTRFNALLGALTIVVILVGSSPLDAMLGVVAIVNSAIGIIQELRAKIMLDKLAIMNTPVAHIMREGQLADLPIDKVVQDDVLKLMNGDQVPADGEVLTSTGLEVDESLLTGEVEPIVKHSGSTVLSGSIVVAGEGFIRATAVGENAYAHTIAKQIKRFSIAKSELVAGINKLLRYISWIILFTAPILAWGQIARSGNSWQDSAVRSIAAVDGMIPNGLVLLTSLSFFVAAVALVRRKVLIQQLPAVEALARVDVLCFDKTGTLTEGHIAFDALELLGEAQKNAVSTALAGFAAKPDSPTLTALHTAFPTKTKAVQTVPFSSARKWSAVEVKGAHWVMGAPEIVCKKDDPLMQRAAEIAAEGKRVMVLLESRTKPTAKALPARLTPAALIVLSERARHDAHTTLEFFAQQGVAVKVISGDSPHTVAAIARQVGLEAKGAIDARTLPTRAKALARAVEEHTIFGRVTPEQKQSIIKALQSKGHTVAMIGDGVNDALALKDADIGIAMASGAQATKSIAELVLLDNSFATMPQVLGEGRRIIANIERVASLFVIKNVYSLCLSLAVTLAALPYPFLPRHLAVISTVSVGIPAFFLSFAPNNQRYVPGFLRRVLQFAVPVGVLMATLIFAGYLAVMLTGGTSAQGNTISSMVAITVGMWVIVCVARPLNWWKLLLVAVLYGTFWVLVLWRFAGSRLAYDLQPTHLVWIAGLSLIGIIFVEILWRRDRRSRFTHQMAS